MFKNVLNHFVEEKNYNKNETGILTKNFTENIQKVILQKTS